MYKIVKISKYGNEDMDRGLVFLFCCLFSVEFLLLYLLSFFLCW